MSASSQATTFRISTSNFSPDSQFLNRNSAIKQELLDWIQRALSILFFFLLYQITTFLNTQPDLSLIPLFMLDIKILITTYRSKTFSATYKFLYSQQSINQFCSISFKILILLIKHTKSFSVSILLIPVSVSFLTHIVHRSSKKEECRYLTWLIFTLSKSLFLLTFITHCLKEKNVINCSIATVFWPVYIGLSICGILTTILILITISALCSWIKEEISLKELVSYIWLLFTLSGSSLTILFTVLQLLHSPFLPPYKDFFCIFSILFLTIFILSTWLNLEPLVKWVIGFFSNSPMEGVDNDETVHEERIQSTGVKVRRGVVVRRVPEMLRRISSNYFRPAETGLERKNAKCMSLEVGCEQTGAVRRRAFSGPALCEDGDFCDTNEVDVGVAKVCLMCYDNFSDTVVMECGHGGICYACSLELWKSTGHCHMCREPISQVLQIEKSKDTLIRIKSTTQAVYNSNT